MTEIRFQADADLRQAIVTGIIRRQPNLNFQSANEAGLVCRWGYYTSDFRYIMGSLKSWRILKCEFIEIAMRSLL